MSKQLQIRNSTVDFLMFTRDAKDDGIEVRVQNNDVWLTQMAISKLFDVDRSVVTKHLKNIFATGELIENSVCANFAQTADDGKTYDYKFYCRMDLVFINTIRLLCDSVDNRINFSFVKVSIFLHETAYCFGYTCLTLFTDRKFVYFNSRL